MELFGKQLSFGVNQEPPYTVELALEQPAVLTEIRLFQPCADWRYNVYVSADGNKFSFAATQDDTRPVGEWACIPLRGKARCVRLLFIAAEEPINLQDIRLYGEPCALETSELRSTFPEDFCHSSYDIPVTPEDTVKEVQGIVRRLLGVSYVDWFRFTLQSADTDRFTLAQDGERIHITGNTGVVLAAGLYHYLKKYCRVQISETDEQVSMPEHPVPLDMPSETVTCAARLRYAFNYCTHSYTMPFWGEEEWQRELDWLALNGVNLVLDITAQEEVWRRFLLRLGYSMDEIRAFVVGPAYGAWAYMANIYGIGGPVPDNWFMQRTELARKNQLKMRRLQMEVVLQGYSGMVPTDIADKDASAVPIPQGLWCGLPRPAMLRPDTDTYRRYAALFYTCQRDVFGDNCRYFAVDPFHEGGQTGDLSTRDIGANVMAELLRAHPKGTWVIQSWCENPSAGLLEGIRPYKEQALILDLYAEKEPHWQEWAGGEFDHTPWLYCQLNNFGGRMGLCGHIDRLATEAPQALKASCCRGIGITPEASRSNPVLWEFFLELPWRAESVDLLSWTADYVSRRYGEESKIAVQAVMLLLESVYHSNCNRLGQGAPESFVNARPAWEIQAASTWGNAVISYDSILLEKAAQLLISEYDRFSGNCSYRFDLADILRQVLANRAIPLHKAMKNAQESGDIAAFQEASARFLDNIDLIERVLSTQREFLVGRWLESAKKLAEPGDDFSRSLYEMNARMLITTWYSRSACELGLLHDYSNRQWAGLTGDYYKKRWKIFTDNILADLRKEKYSPIHWFPVEWSWVVDTGSYPVQESGENLFSLAMEVFS